MEVCEGNLNESMVDVSPLAKIAAEEWIVLVLATIGAMDLKEVLIMMESNKM